jgi:hypothetical protein
MVIQMEDCLDVMRMLNPEVDVLLLFDHPCDHDQEREDGLNVENISNSFLEESRE